jgi:ATP-dependent DNA ligase
VLLAPPVPVALARRERRIPPPGPWSYEPKWDGVRCLVFRREDDIVLQARSGRLFTAHFPDLARAVAEQVPEGVVLDGEIVVWHAGRVDFLAVQRRHLTHPRHTEALAGELPASFVAWDVLEDGGLDWRLRPYRERRVRLLQLLADVRPPLQITPATTDRAVSAEWWVRFTPELGIEGLVIKHLDAPYRGGAREWRKLKHWDARGR